MSTFLFSHRKLRAKISTDWKEKKDFKFQNCFWRKSRKSSSITSSSNNSIFSTNSLFFTIKTCNLTKLLIIYIFLESANEPVPFRYVTLFLRNNPSTPFVRDVTTPFLFYWVLAQSKVTLLVWIPNDLNSWLASWNLWEMLRRALDGIHPTFRQVPPKAPLFSIQTVLSPSWAALMAATYPKWR